MTCPLSKPVFIILGGPNGAGKTTGALSILPQELRIVHFVNADLIARGLSPLDPTLADFDAARMMLQRMRELRERRENFAIETSLSTSLRKHRHSRAGGNPDERREPCFTRPPPSRG